MHHCAIRNLLQWEGQQALQCPLGHEWSGVQHTCILERCSITSADSEPSTTDSVSSWSSRMKTSITCEQSASWSELFSLRMLSPCICLINWRLFSISCVRTNRLVMVRIWMQPFRGKAFADKLQYNTRILIEITYPGVIQFGS